MGVSFSEVDLRRGLSEKQLDELIGARDHRLFLNPRNEVYRERKMKQNPPDRAEAVRLMARYPNLVRRPVFVRGGEVIAGFDAEQIRRLLQ